MRLLGAAVAVWRRTAEGVEWLILHRSHFEPGFAGDWGWGPPAGGADPGESVEDAARRELAEETGLTLPFRRTECGTNEFAVFEAEAPLDLEIRLSWEHDAYRWVQIEEVLDLCRPPVVGTQLVCVCSALGLT